jgi:hypothetical protein
MKTVDEPSRDYEPIEPGRGADLIKDGARAGARVHEFLNLVALAAVLGGLVASLFGRGEEHAGTVAAFASAVVVLVVLLARRAKAAERDGP